MALEVVVDVQPTVPGTPFLMENAMWSLTMSYQMPYLSPSFKKSIEVLGTMETSSVDTVSLVSVHSSFYHPSLMMSRVGGDINDLRSYLLERSCRRPTIKGW